MHNKKGRFKIIVNFTLLILVSIFCTCGHSLWAAELFFGVHNNTVGVGQSFEVGVFLNTHSEKINAVEGTIVVPTFFKVLDVSDGNSIINFWVLKPEVNASGEIVFSGIIPGGYQSEKGYLFSIILEAASPGRAVITSFNESLLLNDGEGTKAKITRAPLDLTISTDTLGEGFFPPHDVTKPEDFTPVISRDPSIFDNQYFLTFATQDKDSGIDHYEVKEGWLKKSTVAESPYLLHNQMLNTTVVVKAIDKRGNERVAIIPPLHGGYTNYILPAILAIIIGVLIYWYHVRKRHVANF